VNTFAGIFYSYGLARRKQDSCQECGTCCPGWVKNLRHPPFNKNETVAYQEVIPIEDRNVQNFSANKISIFLSLNFSSPYIDEGPAPVAGTFYRSLK